MFRKFYTKYNFHLLQMSVLPQHSKINLHLLKNKYRIYKAHIYALLVSPLSVRLIYSTVIDSSEFT